MSRIPYFHQVASQAPDVPTPPPFGGAYRNGYFTLPENSTPANRRDKMPDFTHAGYRGWERKGAIMTFQELLATGLSVIPVEGVTTEAFESARDQASALGGAVIYVPPGVYTLQRNVVSMNTASRNYNNCHWFGDPDQPPRITVLTCSRNLGGAFEFTVDPALINGTQLTVTGITPRGSNIFHVASTTGLQVGQFIKSLLEQEPPYWTPRFYAGLNETDPDANGWYRGVHRIVELGPNWIRVDKPLRETFDPAQGYELKRYQPMRNVSIQNFIFDWVGVTPTGFGGSMRVLRFDWVWDCFAANIYADNPPTSFYHFTDTTHFTGYGTGGRNPKNQGGSGNGYGASLAYVHDSTLIGYGDGPKGTAFPSDPTWPDWLTWRHAPNFQNNAQGNVIRDMNVEGSDFHWHAQYPRQNLLTRVNLRKGADRVGPWLVNSAWIFNIDSGALTPAGNGNVVWGNTFDAFGDDRNGLKFGGLEENWWFCYNHVKVKLSNVEQQASILMFGGYQHGFFRLIGNAFYIEDGSVDFRAIAFAPGLVQGQGQSANGIWPPFTPQYGGSGATGLAAVTPDRENVMQIEGNTFVNVPAEKRYTYGFGPDTGGGEGGPLASQLDADNTWTTGGVPAVPEPPLELLEWQWGFRSANARLWDEDYDPNEVVTAPSFTTSSTITGDDAIGSTLTAVPGTLAGTAPISVAYQWKRGSTNIGTGATYVVTAADAGQTLTCEFTATNAAGSDTDTATVAVAALWTPAAINSKLWAEWVFSQSGVADGDDVTTVVDTQGVRSLTSSATYEPSHEVAELNGKNVANFGSNSRMAYTGASTAPAQPYEYYAVIKLDALVNGQRVIRLGTNDAGIVYGGGTGSTGALRVFAGSDGPVITLTQNQWAIARFSGNGASAEAQLNGGTPVTGNTGTTLAANDTVVFGARNAGETNGTDMHLAYFAIAETPLTTNERQALEGYLAHEYGLISLLPSDHPWKVNPPQV